MEIGGVERSLLGLLDSIDYSNYNVDLLLLSHTGEFMPLINKNVNLLPENKKFSLINLPIASLIRRRNFWLATVRLYCKVYGSIRAKIKGTASINISLCKKYISKTSKPLDKHYDIAIGFFVPHFFLEDKVSADIKFGWVHTDYSNPNEKQDTDFNYPMWKKLDYIACVSEQVKKSFDSIYPSLSNKTIVVENILSSEFVTTQSNAFAVDSEMPSDGSTKILSVGRFCEAKAFDDAVVACKKLLDKGYNVKWYLIGYGPDEQLIRNKISGYNLHEHVIILGKKSNPYPYMKACDIYAQPSRYEGKAVTVREAQMLHKPVIITRFETSASQVEEGVDGYICEMGIDGIVKGVEYLINNKSITDKLIENTKKKQYDNAEEFSKLVNLCQIN